MIQIQWTKKPNSLVGMEAGSRREDLVQIDVEVDWSYSLHDEGDCFRQRSGESRKSRMGNNVILHTKLFKNLQIRERNYWYT